MTSTITETKTYVGQRVKRKEDPRMVTGTSKYLDDIKLPNMHYASIVRSPYAAARIDSIDTKEALDRPGVVGVYTNADLEGCGDVPTGVSLPGLRIPKHPVLAKDRVYYAGHPVAVVVATDPYLARDAVDFVQVEYTPGEGVSDPEKALEPGAPAVHPEWPDNVSFVHKQENGEVDKAFAEAEIVVKQKMLQPRLVASPMEPRGAIGDYHQAEGSLTLYSSTQIPHLLRSIAGGVLGIAEHKVRVIAPEVGGGFGCKADVYAEELLVAHLSRLLGKPVKWVETRREHFMACSQGRGHVDFYEIAAKKDGTITGIKLKIIQDIGSHQQLLTALIPTLSVLMLPGLYKCKTFRAEVVGAFTNCFPTDAYRGAGRPEATYGIERIVDCLAHELGLDPAEIRFKNFIEPQEFPYATGTGLIYDSGNYARILENALGRVGYQELREEQKRARAEGRLLGIGMATYGEICAMGPSPYTPAGGWESATVRIEPGGQVTVHTGVSPHGQGEETTFAQIAADELGVSMDDISIVHGDTAIVQYGIGTFGSRGTAVGGTAMYFAIEELKKKILKYGAMLLESEDVEYAEGGVRDRKSGKSMPLAQIAAASYRALKLPPGTEPGLVATSFWEPTNFTFPFGAHVVVTEVDADTGEVKILRYVAVDDCGKIINPLIVAGQVQGGIAQGIGQALYERMVYDEQGHLLSGEYTDYAMPKAANIPWIESHHTETPSPVNPLGVKGVGEAGAIGAPPAIVNSVVDALSHLGIRHLDMPLTSENVWRAMRNARKGAAA